MIAILRYALLKNLRDGSLVAFVLGPVVMVVAPLTGVGLFDKTARAFPLSMNVEWSAARMGAEIAPMATLIGALFACLSGFWSFRAEVLGKSMGAFLMALRPTTIQIAATLFGAASGFAGYLAMSIGLAVLTTALPPHPLRVLVDTALLCLCAAAAGSLAVTISTEAWSIIPVYLVGILTIPLVTKLHGILPELVAIVATVILLTTSTFLLERRCAT